MSVAGTRHVPKRMRRCPACSDRDSVQYVVWGMPAAPSTDEEDRLYFAGCVIEVDFDDDGIPVPEPRWYCPPCDLFYR